MDKQYKQGRDYRSPETREKNNVYMRQRYWRLRDSGICTRCGEFESEENSCYCLICKMDERERKRVCRENATEQQKAAQRAHNKAREERLRSEGICITCGKRKATEGSCRCERCKARARELGRRARRDKKIMEESKCQAI